MKKGEETSFRLRLAEGFIAEARQDIFPEVVHKQIEDIAKCAELLGANVHIASDYGDEASWRTPWELFDEADARQALGLAEKAVTLARKVIEGP